MNKKLENAAHDMFEHCTPDQRRSAFVVMYLLTSLRAGLTVTEIPKDEPTTSKLMAMFDACQHEERIHVVLLIVRAWLDEQKDLEEKEQGTPAHWIAPDEVIKPALVTPVTEAQGQTA